MTDSGKSKLATMRRVKLATAVVLAFLLIGLGKTLYSRWSYGDVLAQRSEEASLLHVLVTQPTLPNPNSPNMRLVLPGTLLGINEALIHARVNGYVKEWRKDIGDDVKQGETLAVLDIPEINRQVDEATANFQLAKTAYERWKKLRAQDAVSQQELDEKTALYRQSEAVLKRLKQLQDFGTVVAPFSGRVTKRNINTGDLVNSGNVGSAQAMYMMARVDKLHVYAYLPQDRVAQIKVGDKVEVYQPSAPDKIVEGRVARTAGAIDMQTRTLQVDVEIDNANNALMPGTYVEIAFKINPGNNLIVPTNTLIFGAGGPYVASVKDDIITRKKVTLGIDFGMQVEVRSGVTKDDLLILNPLDSVTDGQRVIVEVAKPAAPPDRRGS
ncbi:MAG: efflux RND transporter periplasmic adaptor subunit [Betaproteobacteria bacterium]